MPIPARAVERNALRTERRAFAMTLTGRTAVSRNTTRFTFTAAEFATFAVLGPDEYFGLIIPRDGATIPASVFGVYEDVRQVMLAVAEDERPDVRWYTVRAHRPERAEIDVDIVLHGDAGPASRWASRAAVGDTIGFREAHAPYIAPVAGHQLLVADETALPALGAILESEPDLVAAAGELPRATVFAEVPDPDDVPLISSPVEIRWLHRGDSAPGSQVLPALRRWLDDGPPELGFAWLCGEAEIATGARRMVVDAGLLPADEIMFSGYWRLGRSRG